MDIDKRISESINSSVNVINARFLLAVFAVVVVVVLLTYVSIFATTMEQMLELLLAAAPGGICGIVILFWDRARNDARAKYVVCVLMCLQAFAVAITAYSYAGTIILLLPILLASLYPRTKLGVVVSVVMLVCGIIVPPLALVLGFWDGGYYEFLYDLCFSRPMDTATLSSETISQSEQIFSALQYCSSQNVLIIGAFAVIGRLVYRQTDKSFVSQRDVVRLSETDALTGLLNRRCFERRVSESAIAGQQDAACVYFDVNGLHEMNNTKGHTAGDAMLQFVGDRIRDAFDEDDVFRIGGDEFVAFAKGATSESLSATKASLEEAFASQGYHVAIGYELSDGTTDFGELVQRAEKEMYDSKRAYYIKHNRRRSTDRDSSQDNENRRSDSR